MDAGRGSPVAGWKCELAVLLEGLPLSLRNAPLTVEGRRRLVLRCQSRPITHVAAEAGVSRACLSKWVNRFRRLGEDGLMDRSSVPHCSPSQLDDQVVAQIEFWRRDRKWSAARIGLELRHDLEQLATEARDHGAGTGCYV